MKTIPFFPSEQQKRQALKIDIFHEINQFVDSIVLYPHQTHGPIAIALLESCLLHERILIDFFENSGRSRKKDKEQDDVLVSDYGFKARPLSLPLNQNERL